jgi:hypothetical protein
MSASDSPSAVLLLGTGDDVRITGGDMLQANNQPVRISGVAQLKFTAGTTSHGLLLPAQANRARYEQDGIDVTTNIVLNPP